MHSVIVIFIIMATIGAMGTLIIMILTPLMRYLKEQCKLKEWALKLIMVPFAAMIMCLAAFIASIMITMPENWIPIHLQLIVLFLLTILMFRFRHSDDENKSVSYQFEKQHAMFLITSHMPAIPGKLNKLQQRRPLRDDAAMPVKYELYMKFYSLLDLSTEEKARDFFHLLIEQGEIFVPDRVFHPWRTRLTGACFEGNNLDDAIRIWVNKRKNPNFICHTINMWKEKPFRIFIIVCWNRGAHALFNEIAFWIGSEYLSTGYGTEPLLRIGESLFDYTGGLYGFITRYDAEESHFQRERLNEHLPGIFWAQFLGPLYIDFFGEERIKSAPCYDRKTLTNGGVFLQTAQFPTGQEAPEDRESEKILKDFLNHDAFQDISEASVAVARKHQIKKNVPLFDFSGVRNGSKK
ncbi:MAG: hypothetical protein RDV48_30730 [Candidatus Eremiobacteraeota bacterium]|nr:hypothetical protein [Candidatus Eremiobacteraeota bacterium]